MLKLLILKISLGIKDLSGEEIQALSAGVRDQSGREFDLPGYKVVQVLVPDLESQKTDIKLIYPPSPEQKEDDDYLNYLVEKGIVPRGVIEQIRKDIV